MVWLVGMIVMAGLAGLVVLMRAERVRITSSSADRHDPSVSSATSQG